MINKMEMCLPEGCKKLSLEEMMQNESGWYVNLATGELFITYKDIDTTISWVLSMVDRLKAGSSVDTGEITRTIKRNAPSAQEQGVQGGGFGIRINEQGFNFFQLSEEEMKLASSNSFVFK